MGHHPGSDHTGASVGTWIPTSDALRVPLAEAVEQLEEGWTIVSLDSGSVEAIRGGSIELHGDSTTRRSGTGVPVLGWIPPLPPSSLGSVSFQNDHRTESCYVAGSMANGIASVELVREMSKAGHLSFYGAAGQTPATVGAALQRLRDELSGLPWGCNLIHSPAEPSIEDETARLLVKNRVPCVEASAYLDLTEPLVRMRIQGLQSTPDGSYRPTLRVMAKASRLEVASKFLSPAPAAMIDSLLERGEITPQQARWARETPLCDEITAEADSGGHTDNRPMTTLVPAFRRLRDEVASKFPSAANIRIGAAGGLGTPDSICAALALGADYLVIGSVHQACVESGSSDTVREMLAGAGPADVIMAPASDMFEMGVHLQVLRSGTLFGPRARKLLELYRAHSSIDEIAAADLQRLERDLFQMPIDEVWNQTRTFFLEREPAQIDRARQDPHHKMALVFRWYLGLSSEWANQGIPGRKLDYQIWCGPAMGAFNEWTRGSWLEATENRRVADVSRALMHGAALSTRREDLRRQGIPLSPETLDPSPRPIPDTHFSRMRTTT